jgi:hypothetical protein
VVVGGPRCPRCGQQPSTALPPLSPMQAGGPKLSRVTHHHSFVSLPCGPSILLSSQWMSVREALSLPPTGRLIKSVDSCGAHPPSLSVSHIDESTLKTTLFFFCFAFVATTTYCTECYAIGSSTSIYLSPPFFLPKEEKSTPTLIRGYFVSTSRTHSGSGK